MENLKKLNSSSEQLVSRPKLYRFNLLAIKKYISSKPELQMRVIFSKSEINFECYVKILIRNEISSRACVIKYWELNNWKNFHLSQKNIKNIYILHQVFKELLTLLKKLLISNSLGIHSGIVKKLESKISRAKVLSDFVPLLNR